MHSSDGIHQSARIVSHMLMPPHEVAATFTPPAGNALVLVGWNEGGLVLRVEAVGAVSAVAVMSLVAAVTSLAPVPAMTAAS